MITELIVIALIVDAIHYTFLPGEIFGFVTKIGEKYIHSKLKNPLYACNVCMTPWWGSLIYWLAFSKTFNLHWVLVILAATGLNATLNYLMPDK